MLRVTLKVLGDTHLLFSSPESRTLLSHSVPSPFPRAFALLFSWRMCPRTYPGPLHLPPSYFVQWSLCCFSGAGARSSSSMNTWLPPMMSQSAVEQPKGTFPGVLEIMRAGRVACPDWKLLPWCLSGIHSLWHEHTVEFSRSNVVWFSRLRREAEAIFFNVQNKATLFTNCFYFGKCYFLPK